MRTWTEFHISVVYFSGLLIALVSGIVTIIYLRPIKETIHKITGKIEVLWNRSFKTTVMLAGLFGAMSVSFRDCNGEYSYLLRSRKETISKGLEQVSTSFDYLSLILGLWLIIFLILIVTRKSKMPANNL